MPSAFVIVDVQKKYAEESPITTQRIRLAADALRATMPVMWVYWHDKGDDPSLFTRLTRKEQIRDIFESAKKRDQPLLTPSRGDIVLLKREKDAFTNPRLEPFLRENGIETLYFAGFYATQCVFTSAAQQEFDSHIVTDMVSDHKDETPYFIRGRWICDSFRTLYGPREAKLISSRDIGLNLA